MIAILDDPALIHDQDLIGIRDGGQPVRDDDQRLSLHQSGDRLLNDGFILRISVRRSFVPISTTSANPHKTGTFQKSKDN